MEVLTTEMDGLLVVEPRVFGDERGYFKESWNRRRYADAGLDVDFVQDNFSRSRQGTLRGLHYQIEQPQGKLVSVVRGEVFDVAVDLRKWSETFGRWYCVRLSGENHRQLYVPPGFAHGFLVLSDSADFQYKCTDFYAPEHERTLQWDDPSVGVAWPLDEMPEEPILSEKDRCGVLLESAECYESPDALA